MWESWRPGTIQYRVQRRQEHAHSVERRGRRGGIKTVGVYNNSGTAQYVANALNISKSEEL